MAVNSDYIHKIESLRSDLRDYVEENVLIEKEENLDDELQQALENAIEYINTAIPPETTYTINNFPVWSVLRDQAIIEVLQSNIIKSARNQHSYTDSGGVNIREEDVYGRYVNIFNMLTAKIERAIRTIKQGANADAGYGGVSSEYIYNYGYNRNDRY